MLLSTEYASTIAGRLYYLFNKAHRIIDYKDVEKEIGVIVFSINEEVLKGKKYAINYVTD